MDVLHGMMARWRQLIARSSAESRMDEEIRFHLEMETRKNLEAGLPPAIARRRALIAFGGVENHKESMRDGRRIPILEDLVQDVAYAGRSLRRAPGFTVAVVLALAIGIGATTAMYGVMSRLLLRPPPGVTSAENVVKLYFTNEAGPDGPRTFDGQDYLFFESLLANSTSLARAAAYETTEFRVGSGEDALRAQGTAVSPGFWSTLGTVPAVGRLFNDEEARPIGGARVVVLGNRFWRSRFGADPAVVGSTMLIKGRSYEIIGVAPKGFRGIELSEVDLWLPIGAAVEGSADSLTWTQRRTGTWLSFVGRIADGVGRAQAEAELSGIWRNRIAESQQERGQTLTDMAAATLRVQLGPVIGALGNDMQRVPEARVSVWLLGIAVVLLGVASATVAGLLLLRALRRSQEMAVRLALGMRRSRLAIQLFTESLLLATLGGVVALAVAIGGRSALGRILLPDFAWEQPSFDWRVLGIAAISIAGAAVVAGLAPLLHTRFDAAAVLRSGPSYGASGRSFTRRLLLVGQVALSAVLLIGGGLFVRSLQRIDGMNVGLDRQNVLVVSADFAGTGRTGASTIDFYERAMERVKQLPGVDTASLAISAPLRSARGGGRFRLPPNAEIFNQERGSPMVNYVTPGFFATTGTRILQGRDFDLAERGGLARRRLVDGIELPEEATAAPVLIINETMARIGWPGASPLGECLPFRREEGCATIVGIVENARKFELQEPESMLYYQPLAIGDVDSRVLLVRTTPDAPVGAATIRRALLEIEPTLPYLHIEVLNDPLFEQERPWRLGASVFTVFGALAALLAGMGLYSALGYAITQRTREIGIRTAVGAQPLSVVRLVLREGVGIAVGGVVVGMAISFILGKWIADLLFEVSPRDPLVYAAVGIFLIGVAIVASLGPIRRALLVDPAVAMRAE